MLIRVVPAINDRLARKRLADLARAKREDFAGLSRLINRPSGYLGRYVRDGVPKRLPDRERRTLAAYFGVAECELGAQAAGQ